MALVDDLITENIDIWTSAVKRKSSAGRGGGKKIELYGVKKLRELILDLAVRGLLVPQDPNDEPASVLLERIAAEKAELVKAKKAKKTKPLPAISKEDKSFDLPTGWVWSRISTISVVGTGSTPARDNPTYYFPAEYSWVTSGETSQEYITETKEMVSKKATLETNVSIFPAGTLIIAMYGQGKTRGQITELKIAAGTNQACAAIQLIENTVSHRAYIKLFFRKSYSELRRHAAGGAQPNLNVGKISLTVLPVPPLPEQHRIVAKVDELMALCDQLEQQTESSLTAHKTLVQTLLGALTQAATLPKNDRQKGTDAPTPFTQAWNRLAEHFDTVFTTEDSIEQLKQTILQLAVMGKLVPQDPNDEPASELLKRIAVEKAEFVKAKKIKKQKALPEIGEEEKPFALPDGWEWVKFGEMAEFINGDRGKNYPNRNEYTKSGEAWINTGHIEPNGRLSVNKMNYISAEKFESLRGGKVEESDLVYCLRGATFGKTAFVTPFTSGAIASSLMIIRLHLDTTAQYVYRYLIGPFGRSQIFRFDNGSAQPNLSANSVRSYHFPCPPVEEQQRIVAKVEELMTLCDQLKTRLTDIQATQLQLADAVTEQAIH